MNKAEAIQKIINWSYDAINTSEWEASTGVSEDKTWLMKDLKEVIINCKKAGLSLDEVLEHVWYAYSYDAEKLYLETEI